MRDSGALIPTAADALNRYMIGSDEAAVVEIPVTTSAAAVLNETFPVLTAPAGATRDTPSRTAPGRPRLGGGRRVVGRPVARRCRALLLRLVRGPRMRGPARGPAARRRASDRRRDHHGSWV